MKFLNIAIILAVLSFSCAGAHGQGYPDGQPSATLRLEAKDQGVVLRHGDGPGKCDSLGAREALIFEEKCIGMASVVVVGKRLAIFYDAPGRDSASHMERDLGLAWLELPLSPPRQ